MDLDRFLTDMEGGCDLFVGLVLEATHGKDTLPHRRHARDNLLEVVFEGTGVLPALRFGSRLGAVLHDVLLIDIPDHVVLAVVEEGMLGSREEIAESRLLITETVPVFPQAYKGLLHNLLGEVRIPAGQAQGKAIDMAAIRVVQLLKLPLAGGCSIIAEYTHSMNMTVEMDTSPNRGVIFKKKSAGSVFCYLSCGSEALLQALL